MKGWQRITIVSFVLVGSTASFGYWSINQFNNAFDNLSASYLANTYSVYASLKQNMGLASTSSQEISGEIATSTDETISVITLSTTTATASTSSATDLKLSFIFPQQGDNAYIGCTYQISWKSSTAVSSLETALVDAGIREVVEPTASGLAKENAIKRDLQNLKWKVGVVSPGAYYIKVSKINGVEAVVRSKVFEINEMSTNISTDEQENICKGSGGSF